MIKRSWIISDIHFGVRSNSMEWLDVHKDYFYNYLIPTIKRDFEDGDALFVLGDVFESRQSLNILVLNEAIKVFKTLSEILPVYIILGNHDSYKKSSLDVYSPIIFSTINNINVIDVPTIIKTNNGTKLFMMPWEDDPAKEIQNVQLADADFMFCHTHFMGAFFNKRTLIEEGIKPSDVAKFKKVYCGHIHHVHTINNIRMVGCTFHLTRNDIDNKKQILLVDYENDGAEKKYENNHSPEFKKFKIDDILDLSHCEFEQVIKNNYIDLIIDEKWISKFPYSQLIDSLTGYTKINYILSILQKDYEFEESDGIIDIEELTDLYIENMSYGDNVSDELKRMCKKLYNSATVYLNEKTIEE
jgi:DNA repair exonuclease SbcCD nuclease subunit